MQMVGMARLTITYTYGGSVLKRRLNKNLETNSAMDVDGQSETEEEEEEREKKREMYRKEEAMQREKRRSFISCTA